MEKLFCISAGQLVVKKADNVINKKNRYLNYGLLTLATILKSAGWNAVQIQGHFDTPLNTLNQCIKLGYNQSSKPPLLISIPSFYAVSWVNEFIDLAKDINLTVKFIVGGRWVIAGRTDLMKHLIPSADVCVIGMADVRINEIVHSCTNMTMKSSDFEISNPNIHPALDYSILTNRALYQPSIEISRGCGMGCSFCQEKNEKLLQLKKPTEIVSETETTLLNDDLNKMNLYFEASLFIPNGKWVDGLLLEQEKCCSKFEWRAESRVDTLQMKHIEKLAKTGLKVLDLGLESASPLQLTRMNKTKNPEIYLSKASALVKSCYYENISVKINVLLSAGETEETISETEMWLETHAKYITGVSAGPLIVYGWADDTRLYREELESHGASVSHSPLPGICNLDLSDEIDYEKSIDISNHLSSRFMTAEDYFYLKSFSYFSRDYTFENFLSDVQKENGTYSFSRN